MHGVRPLQERSYVLSVRHSRLTDPIVSEENYCPKQIDTYNAKYPNGDWSHGGYSSGIRCHEKFTFKVPDELELEQAASMFCGGLTTYSPLVRNGCGPGKKVGVVGIGGRESITSFAPLGMY